MDRFGLILIDSDDHRVSEQNLDSTDSTLRDTFERSEVDFAFSLIWSVLAGFRHEIHSK